MEHKFSALIVYDKQPYTKSHQRTIRELKKSAQAVSQMLTVKWKIIWFIDTNINQNPSKTIKFG